MIPQDPNKNDSDNRLSEISSSNSPSHYVGIGASAGGLEAIEEFFKQMPPRTGLAFVVIQHLSPDYKSLMGELLAKHTEIPIYKAENGMIVETDSIYLIPPKKNLTIFHGKLILTEQDHSQGINLPIDVFLKSLADDQAEKAIAVILSGTGSDGTRGVRAIKESGGMVMVQDEDSAKFDGMPRSASSTGLADFILEPGEMPKQLLSFSKHPYATKSEISDTLLGDDDGLTRLFALLRDKHRIDFTYYKPSTVVRRIERRMTVNQIHELRDYVKYMESYPREITNLYRELLIGVTSFFRDPEAFATLAEKWIPQIISNAKEDQIRFWVPGCSTGEEAYSLAILCQEAQKQLSKSVDIKIFATDIDAEAIQKAATGIYPESITADLSPHLLARYFYKHDDLSFHVSRNIREMVVFANQNIIKDPPFTNISLVSCRNLMIYLQPVLQKKILQLINFSLLPEGILFLGTSETTGEMTDYYEALDHRWKIYCSKGRQNRVIPRTVLGPATDISDRQYIASATRSQTVRFQEEERILDRVLQSIAGHYFTCALVVNENGELLHILGDAGKYLKFPAGRVLNKISKIAIKELSIPLSTGIQRVLKNRKEEQYPRIRLNQDDSTAIIQIRLCPLPGKRNQESLVLVLIDELKEESKESEQPLPAFNLGVEAEQRIYDLEQELQFSKENLQATIEELETSNEELQATNEELLASNEELQSTNQELQSVNEELFTVNAEYQKKILELTESNNDVNNLLSSSDEIKLFLDENLDIRVFNPVAKQIFKLLQSDIGRPFGHISHNLKDMDLMELANKVLKSSEPIRKEVENDLGQTFLMRILPYYVSQQYTSGVSLNFTDITELKKAQEEIKEQIETLKISEAKHRILFESMAQGVVYQDIGGDIVDANDAAQRILGLDLDQMRGRTSMDPQWKSIHEDGSHFPGEEHPAMVALETGEPVNDVIMGIYHPEKQQRRWIKINAVPKKNKANNQPFQVFTTFDDITDLKQSEKKYKDLFETMTNGFAYHKIITDEEGVPVDYLFLEINSTFESMTGLHKKDVVGREVTEIIPNIKEDEIDWIAKYGKVALTGEPARFKQYSTVLEKWFSISAYSPVKEYFAVLIELVETT